MTRLVTGSLAVAVTAAWFSLPVVPCAAGPVVNVVAYGPGKTPFINLVHLHMTDTSLLDHVQFTIAPKPGSVTRPISARYSAAYLAGKGDLDASTGSFTVPVFGLYAGYQNSVQLVVAFTDGSSQTNALSLTAPPYVSGIYNHPKTKVQARTTSTALSYDFIEMKSSTNPHSPTIVDTDGEMRWVGTTDDESLTVIFYDNSFYSVKYAAGAIDTHTGIGPPGTTIVRNDFDGSVTPIQDYLAAGVSTFHHNLDVGKTGILCCTATPAQVDCTIMEIDTAGNILKNWNLATIISDAMIAGGDDPTKFVAADGSGIDWFHNNANAYRPSTNELVVSSRENFVIGLDYDSGAIKWILGDPSKQWHEFASLRKFALKATAGSHYPIGQHAVSFYRDKMLLFDDGDGSTNHKPAGLTRTYSAPRKYTINETAHTADEIWNYLADPAIFSPITSSVYEDEPNNYLIDYAVGGPFLFTELVGLLPSGAKAFDYQYALVHDVTAWNSIPIHLENLVFD